jgi:hypothetical protein
MTMPPPTQRDLPREAAQVLARCVTDLAAIADAEIDASGTATFGPATRWCTQVAHTLNAADPDGSLRTELH